MNISTAAARTGVNAVTLRYYERIGLIPEIQRSSSGIRDYTMNDIEWIKFIKCMRRSGLPIDSLAEYTRLYHIGEETAEKRKQILLRERDNLLIKRKEIEDTLGRLNQKIKNYDSLQEVSEKIAAVN